MPSKLEISVSAFDKKQAKDIPEIRGLLGIPLGGIKQVNVPNRNAYVYVRLRENQNEVIQAFNETISPAYDMPVIVIRRGNSYYVKGRDTDRFTDWGDSSPFLPLHGNSHSFNPDAGGGGDLVFVYPRQMMPMLSIPSGTIGGPNVIVTDYNLHNADGSWKHIGPTGTANILFYKPLNNQAIMALVYVDAISGNPYFIVNSGTTFANTITGSADIVPYIPTLNNANYIPDMAIRLTSGTAVIGWDNMYDVRQFLQVMASGTGGGGGIPEAPIDGNTYGRKNAAWSAVSGSSGGGGSGSATLDTYWIITPPQITSNQNDWSPAGYSQTTRTIKVSSDATRNITGLVGGSGTFPERRLMLFQNIGTNNIILTNQDALSVPSNQFWNQIEGASGVTLAPNQIVQYQYEPSLSLWAETKHSSPSGILLNKIVLNDELGRISDVDFLSFRPDTKQFIFGSNEVGIPGLGGAALHVIDEAGHTGGEIFMWGFGTGTGGFTDQTAGDFTGRYWGVRGRGTEPIPLGILKDDEMVEFIGFGFGDNGQYNATGEPGQAEITNRAKMVFRAAGDFTDTSRPSQIEFWTVPSGTLVKNKVFTIQDNGGVNLSSGTYNISGSPHSHSSVSISNGIINGDCIVGQTWAVTLSTTPQFGVVDRFAVYATGSSVSAGNIMQDASSGLGDTGYALYISGTTIAGSSGTVFTRYRMESKDAVDYKNQVCSFGVIVSHDISNINYIITIRKSTTKDGFTAFTNIATNTTSVPSGTVTQLKLENVSMGDCSNGIEIEVKAVCGAITTKNFRFAQYYFGAGISLPVSIPHELYASTLEKCFRYCIPIGDNISALNSVQNYAYKYATSFIDALIIFPVDMFKSPTLSTATSTTWVTTTPVGNQMGFYALLTAYATLITTFTITIANQNTKVATFRLTASTSFSPADGAVGFIYFGNGVHILLRAEP